MKTFQDYLEEDAPSGGYVDTMQNGIDTFDSTIRDLREAFFTWKGMPGTEKSMHGPAIKELVGFIERQLKDVKEFENKKDK